MCIPHLRNSALYFLNPKPNFLKKELTLIYISSDSPEEKKITQIHINMPNSQRIYTLLKTLANNNYHLFRGAESKLVTARYQILF